MRRAVPLFASLILALTASLHGQQTALTEAHLKSAGIEVPKLMELLGLKPGMSVADVGAGFGAWMMALSRALGPEGHVYATEIGQSQLAALREAVKRERLTNVTVIEGGVDDTKLPASCCEAVLVRDVYHHVTSPDAIVRSIAGALKPGGRLAVIDFPPRPNSEIPAGVPADRKGHGVPADVVEREFKAALTHVRTVPEWSPESQPASLYLVLFRKQ